MHSKSMHWGLLLPLASSAWAAHRSSEWHVQQRAPPDASMTLHIGLTTSDSFAGLKEAAAQIADPGNQRYRKHLSGSELQILLTPHPSDTTTVSQWLQGAGLSLGDISQRGHIIDARMKVRQAEQLLQTKYNVYTDGWIDIIRSENSYRLPQDIRDMVDFVSPTNTFPEPSRHEEHDMTAVKRSVHSPRQSHSCGADDVSSPACIRQVYNITYSPEPNRTTFAVYATEAAMYNAADVQAFLDAYNEPAAEARASYQVIGNGDAANGEPGGEGAFETALTTQTLLGLAWPAQGTFYNLGGVFGPMRNSFNSQNLATFETYDPFVTFLQDMIHNETVPSVVSFSQSWAEDQVSPDYARSICTMLQAIGARGVTLIFSSGNNGAQGNQPDQPHRKIFEPKFPASCPYVTSAGGTTNLAEETAATQSTVEGVINKASLIASGGGFSNLFPTPDYQNASVASYISSYIPSTYSSQAGFNSSGRGIPDISAFSTSFPIVINNSTVAVGGTSAAAPVWAAIIALLNDYEISKGRPTLGFVNPWLYSLPEGTLKDITTGGNNSGQCPPQGNGTSVCQALGYQVTSGWDPVTGLGSPMFSRLVEELERQAAGGKSTNGTSGGGSGPGTSGPSSGSKPSASVNANMLMFLILGVTMLTVWVC